MRVIFFVKNYNSMTKTTNRRCIQVDVVAVAQRRRTTCCEPASSRPCRARSAEPDESATWIAREAEDARQGGRAKHVLLVVVCDVEGVADVASSRGGFREMRGAAENLDHKAPPPGDARRRRNEAVRQAGSAPMDVRQ
jgi:hypothetical protein